MTRHHPWSQRRMGIRAGVPGPPDEHGDCPFGAAVARRRFSHCLSRRVANRCYVSHVFCKACAPTTSSVVNGSPWRAQVSNASASLTFCRLASQDGDRTGAVAWDCARFRLVPTGTPEALAVLAEAQAHIAHVPGGPQNLRLLQARC